MADCAQPTLAVRHRIPLYLTWKDEKVLLLLGRQGVGYMV